MGGSAQPPSDFSESKKQAEKVANAGTFKAVSEEWLEAGCPGGMTKSRPSDKTIAQLRQRLKKYVYPKVRHMPMRSIKPANLRGVTDPISKRGRRETAHRIHSLCERIFHYAIATQKAERNLAADLRYSIAPIPKTKGFAAILDPGEFVGLLNAIDGYEGQPATMAVLRLAPLLFVRPIELRTS